MADYNCSQPFLFLFYNKKTNNESTNHETTASPSKPYISAPLQSTTKAKPALPRGKTPRYTV